MSHTQSVSQTLSEFARQPGCFEGIDLSQLAAGTIVSVTTRHSQYRFVLIDPREGRALVTGSKWFPEPTEVRIAGATAGGSCLKAGWIGAGLNLEMSVERRRITTSRVESYLVSSANGALIRCSGTELQEASPRTTH